MGRFMRSSAIAIVGMAGRFPAASDLEQFWRNLRDGVASVRTLSDDELGTAGVPPEALGSPNYVKAAAVLDGVEMFDASFFGFSPKDAAIMDPQHRHFLECAWEALEHAGHAPSNFTGSIGVFAGSGMNAYLIHNLLANRQLMDSAGLFLVRQTGNDKDVLATRASYQLDLHGPSVTVQTACSTSLVAVHLACQSLLSCECDMALAGGVTIEIPHGHGYFYRDGEILSRDGRCRPFDAAASGTVFSSGVGIVVLRRLEDALADHDTIHAVILGTAINNDGQRKVGYLAPSVAGQADVVAEALGVAGVTADSISYVETHGTGTAVGDPLEIKALTQAFRRDTSRMGYCAIGSLKSNVGHLDSAAGVAGLIKTVLALKHKQIPPSLNFQTANPQIDFVNSPFYVNSSLADWPAGPTPRRAGVTSLGIGGTNAHAILEEAPMTAPAAETRTYQLMPISAKSDEALNDAAARMAAHLRDHPELPLADVAYTLQAGRTAFRHRRIAVARDLTEAARLFSADETPAGWTGVAPASGSPSVAFLFPGQGSQYVNMGAELYASEPVFGESIDRCAEILTPLLGIDLRTILYPAEERESHAAEQLSQTRVTQPALFAVEYALAQWWLAHGVSPRAMVGHSVGELVAACVAGVFSLEDAVELVALRGRLMQECGAGAMLAVARPFAEVALASDQLWLAAVNSPDQCVFSGPAEAVVQLEHELGEQRVPCRKLPALHAFHSSMMDPILDEFRRAVGQRRLHAPRIPFLSNVTGTWITPAAAVDPDYWASQLRSTVRFSDCVTVLLREPGRLMIEVGPEATLVNLVRQHIRQCESCAKPTLAASMRRREQDVSDTAFLLSALGQVWIAGQPVDWSARRHGEPVSRIPLPTYPFQRKRFWIEPDPAPRQQSPLRSSGSNGQSVAPQPIEPASQAARHTAIDGWFYEKVWQRTAPAAPAPAPATRSTWLVFRNQTELSSEIVRQLRDAGSDAIEVRPGRRFRQDRRGRFEIRPDVREDYGTLLAELAKRGIAPRRAVHLWSLRDRPGERALDESLDLSFYSLLFLGQALAEHESELDLAIVSDRVHSVTGECVADPVAATLLGPTRVIPKECPGIACRNIDVDLTSSATRRLAGLILAEQASPFSDPVVAYRRGERWVERLNRCDLASRPSLGRLREGGVYLITGGLGDLGLVIAAELARSCKARLVLLGRSPFPPAPEWQSVVEAGGARDRLRRKIQQVSELTSLGAEVVCVTADVCRRDEMERAIDAAMARFGSLNGVIHAAGVIEDGPLQLKSGASAASVLAPKVTGTQVLTGVLDEVMKKRPEIQVDFLALFSSASSFEAPAGQVDYAAANAYLDAFAAGRSELPVIAINWGPWREIGMAARARSMHPLLARRVVETPDEIVFGATLSLERQWVLAQHRLKSGAALYPGTAYLEMAAAALPHGSSDECVEFHDVFFLAPLLVRPGEAREARVQLKPAGGAAFQFSISARDDEWVEHASGRIAGSTEIRPADCDVDSIKARCRSRELRFDESRRTMQERFFDFGPRWRCLQAIHIGEQEAIADLELPPAFLSDLAAYRLHPALLDLATGSALYLVENYGDSESVYFPFSYQRAAVYRSIPLKFFSHIRSRPGNEAGRDVVTFDITLLDERGGVLAEINEFSMRLIREPKHAFEPADARRRDGVMRSQLADELALDGIPPDDGAKAFARILASDVRGGVFVLPRGPKVTANATIPAVATASSESVPEHDIGSMLARWWQDLLGVEHVGLDDDFFDLGGHSLIVVRLFGKIKKTYGVDLGLSTLFQARTVRTLGRLIRESGGNSASQPPVRRRAVAIRSEGTQLPLFVFPGIGGHVINFQAVASSLGDDQPIYGLVPRGLEGTEPAHGQVEEMAAYYVEAIREIQPEGPYRLLGYSFGGIVAFEVAQQLIAGGQAVGFLGMLDTVQWQSSAHALRSLTFRDLLSFYRAGLTAEFGDAAYEGALFGPFWNHLSRKSSGLFSRLTRGNGATTSRESISIKEAHRRAGLSYRPSRYPGRLTLFRSTTRGPWDHCDEFLGWADLAALGIELHHVPSNHQTILEEPAAAIIAEKLRECLDRDLQTVGFTHTARSLSTLAGADSTLARGRRD
jgi:acyl transferase domain-containing protein/thioesterase domain-containing protein